MIRPLILALVALIALPFAALGERLSLVSPPFRPALSLNLKPDLCKPFLAAWTTVFDSTNPLGPIYLDLESAYPEFEVIKVPSERELAQGFSFVGNAIVKLIFVGDRPQPAILQFQRAPGREPQDYYNVGLYLVRKLSDYEAAFENAPPPRFRVESLPDLSLVDPPTGITHLYTYQASGSVLLLHRLDDLWAVSTAYLDDEGWLVSDLVHLGLDGTQEATCRVDLLPPDRDIDLLIDSDPFLTALNSLYGGPQGEYCLVGHTWNARDVREYIRTLLFRPQLIGDFDKGEKPKRGERNGGREVTLFKWGLSDPVSWQVYLALKENRIKFRDQLARYYEQQLETDPAQAKAWSNFAYTYLIDSVIYFYYGQFFIAQEDYPFDPGHGLSQQSSPEDVGRYVMDGWAKELGSANSVKEKLIRWSDLTQAAVFLGHDDQEVARFLLGFASDYLSADRSPDSTDRPGNFSASHLADQLLSWATDRPEIVRLALEKGANPNHPSNFFGKTALMYAAQGDKLQTAQILLSSRADVNIPTEIRDYAEDCGIRLERDHRTALMYAAENASLDMIRLLLDHGARVSDTDTKGNTALWYLSRNTVLTPAERGQATRLLAVK